MAMREKDSNSIFCFVLFEHIFLCYGAGGLAVEYINSLDKKQLSKCSVLKFPGRYMYFRGFTECVCA